MREITLTYKAKLQWILNEKLKWPSCRMLTFIFIFPNRIVKIKNMYSILLWDLSASLMLTHWILTKTPWRRCYNYPHLTDEETEALKWKSGTKSHHLCVLSLNNLRCLPRPHKNTLMSRKRALGFDLTMNVPLESLGHPRDSPVLPAQGWAFQSSWGGSSAPRGGLSWNRKG